MHAWTTTTTSSTGTSTMSQKSILRPAEHLSTNYHLHQRRTQLVLVNFTGKVSDPESLLFYVITSEIHMKSSLSIDQNMCFISMCLNQINQVKTHKYNKCYTLQCSTIAFFFVTSHNFIKTACEKCGKCGNAISVTVTEAVV